MSTSKVAQRNRREGIAFRLSGPLRADPTFATPGGARVCAGLKRRGDAPVVRPEGAGAGVLGVGQGTSSRSSISSDHRWTLSSRAKKAGLTCAVPVYQRSKATWRRAM